MHASLQHVLLNLWCLLVFGPSVERRLGTAALLLIWVAVGYSAMGVEITSNGFAKVGLSELTYALLGSRRPLFYELRQRFTQPKVTNTTKRAR
jgi:membrane associated rhomboid family serine protease